MNLQLRYLVNQISSFNDLKKYKIDYRKDRKNKLSPLFYEELMEYIYDGSVSLGNINNFQIRIEERKEEIRQDEIDFQLELQAELDEKKNRKPKIIYIDQKLNKKDIIKNALSLFKPSISIGSKDWTRLIEDSCKIPDKILKELSDEINKIDKNLGIAFLKDIDFYKQYC